MKDLVSLLLLLTISINVFTQKPRAKDVGIPFEGVPGKNNAITDVQGVQVGFNTITSGQGKNIRGKVLSVSNI